MSHFWDVEYMLQQLDGKIKIVKELPQHLVPNIGSYEEALDSFDAANPDAWVEYALRRLSGGVITWKCGVNLVSWSTPELSALRSTVFKALVPSNIIMKAAEERRDSITQLLWPVGIGMHPNEYVSMHLRSESDWYKYCLEQPKNMERTWIKSFARCYVNSTRAGMVLANEMQGAARLGLAPKLLYVGCGEFTAQDAISLLNITKFMAVANEQAVCFRRRNDSEIMCRESPTMMVTQREVRAAVDLQLLADGLAFVGNVYSSLSFTVRVMKYMKRDPLKSPSNAFYYNHPPAHVALDIDPVETRRFKLFSGTLNAAIYDAALAPRTLQLMQYLETGHCRHLFEWSSICASPPKDSYTAIGVIKEINIVQATVEGGELYLEGSIRTSVPRFHPSLAVLVDGAHIGMAYPTRYGAYYSPRNQPSFMAWLPLKRMGRVLQVCTSTDFSKPVLCSPIKTLRMQTVEHKISKA